MIDYTKEMLARKKEGAYRTGELTMLDRYFDNRLNELGALTYDSYNKTEYKNALKYGLFEYEVSDFKFDTSNSFLECSKHLS
jgi:leucyl-tRNA synthetase